MNSKPVYYNLSERKVLLRFVDILLCIVGLWIASSYFNFNYVVFNNPNIKYWLTLLLFYYFFFGEIFQLYNLNVSNNRYLIVRSVIITAFATTIFYIFTPFIAPSLPVNRLQIVYFFLIISIPVLIWRFLYMWLIFSPKYFKNVVFIGESTKIKELLFHIKGDNSHNLFAYVSDVKINKIPGFKDVRNVNLSELIAVDFITEVIVSNKGFSKEISDALNKELILLFEAGVNIKSYESFYEEVTNRVPKEYLNLNFYKNIQFSKNNTNRLYLYSVRSFDFIVSIFGILAVICLIPFIFIGNFIANRGPLFYTQERVGKNGVNFKIYKFRSMVKNAEKDGAVWSIKNDHRITVFGRFLRNTRLDEFPQFFNILKGDMSLIGPRPERPKFVEELKEKIPFYAIRHVVRPGLTGWAQVNYPYASTIEEQEIKLHYDLYYIKERNSFLDFKIIIKTITTVLYSKGQ